MRPGCLIHSLFIRWLPVFLAGLYAVTAGAQGDPPGRVGQLSYTEGPVTFSPAGDNEWIDAQRNRPLTRGDRFWTDKGSRAEIQVGSSTVRMDGQTQLEVLALDDQSTQLSVTQGTLYVHVRSLPEGENFEIDTPNLAYRAAYPGDYRVDVDAAGGTTRVTIHSGTGAVYGETGQSLPLGGGQQITFRARTLAELNKHESPPLDNFDRWAAERNRREEQSVAARYVPRETVGYQQLDAHGQWAQDPTYGAVWFPQGTPAGWAPYRDGHWEWIAPWGWTWIDDAPWGFTPSHYGRWAMIHSRWGWVPGRLGLRPVYAPALVAFIGGGSSSAWSIPIAAGRPGVAWFPLAPGEAWQPGFKASPLYVSNVNRNMSPPASTSYLYQSQPEALTAISSEDFHRGRPVRGSWLRVAANVLTKAQVVPPPPMPDSRALAARERPATARAAPPQPDVRQVAAAPAASPPRPQPSAAQQEALQQQARAQTAKLQQQAKAEQAKAEQAKAEQAKAEAKLAEQAKAKQAEHAKAEQAKLAEQARSVARAKAAEQAQLAHQLKAAEQAKLAEKARAERVAQHSRAEQARLAQQTQAAEHARRVQQAKADATPKRERQARRTAAARPPNVAQRHDSAAKRTTLARRPTAREEQARHGSQARSKAYARREEKARHDTHAQRVEQTRRLAEREAESLRAQRELARREGQEREQAQRESWDRYQRSVSEQSRREQQALEQQRERARQRPSLRNDRPAPPPPEIWQRGIPILNFGRTS